MKYREIMRAEQAPDVYDGPRCDQIRPRWIGSGDGDKDGDGLIGDVLELAASTFPPGTKVAVSVPECPQCGDSADLAHDQGYLHGRCSCGFDWTKWAREQYS